MPAGFDASDLKAVKARLDQIVEAVNDESMPLDDALALYEEAVKLGERASAIMEADLLGEDEGDGEVPHDAAAAGAGAAEGGSTR